MGGIPVVKLKPLKRKSGTFYQISYTGLDGQRKRFSGGSNKRLAEQIAAQLQADLINGKFNLIPDAPELKSIPELISEYLEVDSSLKSQKTISRYEAQLAGFEKFMRKYFSSAHGDIRLIKDFHIRECRDKLASGYKGQRKWAPATVNRTLEMIGGMLKFAVEKGYLPKNPATGTRHIPIPENELPQFYSEEQLKLIWNELDNHWLPYFQFLYFTGIRKGEGLNLTWNKVYLDAHPPFIEVSSSAEFRTKTKKTRTVTLNALAKQILFDQKDKDPKYVFPGIGGGLAPPNSPYRVLKRALDKLKIDGDIHKFRHTFASHLIMRGASITDLQKLLGHSSVEMTQKYAHLSKDHLQDVVNKLVE